MGHRTRSISAAPILLHRVVRVPLAPDDASDPARKASTTPATLAGLLLPHGLGALHDIKITVAGHPDPVTGYLVNIQELDAAVHAAVAPRLRRVCADRTPFHPGLHPGALLAQCAEDLRATLPSAARLHALTWCPTPLLRVEWNPSMPHSAILSRQFEFAAAHRLHCPQLSDEENRRLFGKCNSPNGHGHNYQLEVSVRTDTGAPARHVLLDLEKVVETQVLRRFDHKHLNVDTEEFCEVNPSVENIAAVCYALLDAPLRACGLPLVQVQVWETQKTSATYPAPA